MKRESNIYKWTYGSGQNDSRKMINKAGRGGDKYVRLNVNDEYWYRNEK